jgi:hypothetical protein
VPRTLAAIVFFALLLPSSAGAVQSTSGAIVFTSTRDGNEEIYAANADGSSQRNLTQNAAADRQPALSPDGSHVAFSTNRDGRFDIYVMNADGTNPTRITDGDLGMDAEPAWSPDGTRLVFASTRPFNDAWHIWMVNADGSNLHQLTGGFGVSPAWSPDGSTIAYVGSDQLWVAGADGGNPHALAMPLQGVGPMAAPAWSPDGSRLAFSVQGPLTSPSMASIFVSGADGSNPQQVTDWGSYFDSEPQWSSDGTTIMFQRYFGGSNPLELFATTLDRRFFAGVVTAPGDNYQPSWVTVPQPPPPAPDTTPPTITLTRPTAGTDQYDVYTVGQVVLASYSCADEAGGSGLRHCFGTVANGTPIDTRFIGLFDFYVFAADNAGNPVYKWTKYRVVYPFSGFFAPIVSGLNDLRAGDSAPLKFSLGADYGLDAITGATQQQEDCASGQLIGSTAPANGTPTYNAAQSRYLYDWATDKAWAGTCRAVTLTLRDGTAHRADFRLTK